MRSTMFLPKTLFSLIVRSRRIRVSTIIFLSVAVIAIPAYAVVSADSARIGTHPTYGSGYSAFWGVGADYSLLTDGVNTFVNAPLGSGATYFRAANVDRMVLSGSGLSTSLPVVVTVPSDFTGVYAHSDSGYGMNADSSSGYGILATSDTGVAVYARSTTSYAVFANGNMLVAGTASKPGGGQWAATSDLRVKKELKDFSEGLSELERVRPVRFKYNGLGGTSDDGQSYVGVVAQEVEKVLPWMVSERSEKLRSNDTAKTAIKQVDPSAFTYMLINAVKELAAENRALKQAVCAEYPKVAICRGNHVARR